MAPPVTAPSEAAIQRAIQLHVGSLPDYRLWRTSVGAAYNAAGQLIPFGLPGWPDLTGIRRTVCPQCHLAGPGQFVGIEVKRPAGRRPAGRRPAGRLSEHQASLGATFTRFGGIYIVAHSLAEACEALGLPVPRA